MIFKRKTSRLLVVAGTSTLLLVGCVSTRKYKDSRNALQTARNDSAILADKSAAQQATGVQLKQQIGELNGKQSQQNLYVSLQEILLFPSGSAVVNPKGKEAMVGH
jgi:outer membrane protein OmpA-like peptidoglycan-associated protein